MKAIYKRELKAYLRNVYGFLFAAILLLVVGVMIFLINLNPSLPYADMTIALQYGELALLLMVPILCMRSMSEDRRLKINRFYFSLPLKTSSVVWAKYLALLTVFAIPTLVICVYPLILGGFGTVNYLHTYLSIFMFFLLGACLMAICMFFSSLTGNMAVSAIVGVSAMVTMYLLPHLAVRFPSSPLFSFIGLGVILLLGSAAAWLYTKKPLVGLIAAVVTLAPLSVAYFAISPASFEGLLSEVLCGTSPFFLFNSMVESQLLDLLSVVTLVSFALFFIFLTVMSARSRRSS